MSNPSLLAAEKNEACIRRYYQALNDGNWAALDDLVAPGFIHHTRGMPDGLITHKRVLSMFRRGFPDLHSDIETLLAAGEMVVAHTTTRGTHRGSFLGHSPTGKQFEATGIDIFRLADGRMVERWGVFDTIAMLQQLGLYTPGIA